MHEAQGTHFYFIAVTGPGGFRSEAYGTMTPAPGDTRLDAFLVLRAAVLEKCPHGSGVSAFSFEPNEIGG